MQFPSGKKLGPYEIVAPLGAGGMGEVYRARDARLSREVAIKVLPQNIAQDSDALARFEREARAVAALSHPNILGIFDIGREEGAVFAVTELLEGRTLRDEMSGSALALRRATDYAVQIARGLAAAHEKGIIHRDLKPENIFVTKDGRVKILDFGLAKRLEVKSDDGSAAATASHRTDPGTVMGTIGYMSPEQVRGRAVDPRTDIFSFGAILYEMLSGKPAFRRETSSDTTVAILKEEPPELSETGRSVPPSLDRIVRHCIEKDAERRFHSASDIAFDLESLSQVSSASGARTAARPRAKFSVQAILLSAAILALPLAWWLGTRRSRSGTPEFHRMTFERGTVTGARYGPDGQTVVYSAAWNGEPVRIYSTRPQVAGSTPVALPDAGLLAISKSGELALAVRFQPVNTLYSTGTLARVAISGGAPREILDSVISADWSPDGSELAAAQIAAGKTSLQYPIGKTLYSTGGWISHIRISPDGRSIAFLDHPSGSDGGSVSVIAAAGGSKRDLSTGWGSIEGLTWSPDGAEVWFTGTRVGAATKIYGVTPSGRERLILATPNEDTLWDISADGRVLMTEDDWRAQMSAMAPGAKQERDLSNLDYALVRSITPDGEMISFDETGEGGGDTGGVYIRRTDGSPAIRLGDGGAGNFSPDRKWVVSYSLDRSKLVLLPTGPGQPVSIVTAPIQCTFPIFLPDGKRVVFRGSEPSHGDRVYVIDVAGGKARAITPEGVPYAPLSASPDGRLVISLGPEGRPTLFPVDGGTSRPVPGTGAGDAVTQWVSDGKSVYVNRVEGPLVRVSVVNLETGERKSWRTIEPSDPAGVHGVARAYPAPDGRAYAYSFIRILSTLLEVKGLK